MAVYPEPVVADDRTFERLYASYASNVFRYALTVVGQRADAEDVTQTTFMNAYRAFQRGERPQKPEQWLISIAHNACLQRFRRSQRRPREVALHSELAVATFEDDRSTTVAELQRAIEQLPPAQRAALVMRELEGRSYRDMAASLQISVSALETLLFRARRTLREQLGEQLSCDDATAAIARQLEGRLPNDERRALRAHLRTCDACATYARSMRAQRRSSRGMLNLPFPSWLGRLVPAAWRVADGASSTGGIGAAGIAVKAAAVVVAGSAVGGGAYVAATHAGPLGTHSTPTHASRGATQATAAARSRSHGVAAASQALPQSGGTALGLPADGQTDASIASPPPAAGSSDASTGGALPPAQADGTNNPGQATTEAPGAQGAGSPQATASPTQSGSPAAAQPAQAKENTNGTSASSSVQGASASTTVQPDQAKKDTTPTASASTNPNGNANANGKANANGNANAAAASAQGASIGTSGPPGQANKDLPSTASTDPAAASPAASPTTPAAGGTPPGLAKKDTSAPADPAPADPASTTTASAPPVAAVAPTPPGQAKKTP